MTSIHENGKTYRITFRPGFGAYRIRNEAKVRDYVTRAFELVYGIGTASGRGFFDMCSLLGCISSGKIIEEI